MTNLTIGQRIAAQRKLAGMSQESLGERLEVSRQAVSKWESDGAIPEIDKLISLSRLFGVSVGWLLGTEQEAGEGLNETQVQTVEQIIRENCQPRRPRWKSLVSGVCLGAIIIGMGSCGNARIAELKEQNGAAQDQILALTSGSQEMQAQMADLQTQVDQMNTLLEAQSEQGKLLRSYLAIPYLTADGSGAELDYIFVPKVYHENMTAYLSIRNPATGLTQMLECNWVVDRYMVRATLPLADNYLCSFLLVSDSGYQEEPLAENVYFTDLDIHSRFYMEETEEQYLQRKQGEQREILATETDYSFNVPLYMPFIREKNGKVPFREVRLRLTCNGETLWEEDYTGAFKSLYTSGAFRTPLEPQVQVTLPELKAGDCLRLELISESYDGRDQGTVLDEGIVTDHLEP